MPTKKKADEEKTKKKAAPKKSKETKTVKAKKETKTAAKPAKEHKTVKAAVKPAEKEVTESTVAAEKPELMPKVQCYNHGKKTICAHLLLTMHKCSAKRSAPDRLSTVRIGKKRRCEFYEETTLAK